MSLYNQLGGEDTIDAVVDHFYENILKDQRLNSFFKGIDMQKQGKLMKSFLTYAFGGPHEYSGEDLRSAHVHLVEGGLNDSHFDAMKENIGHTLKEYGIPEILIDRIDNIIEHYRKDILNK